MAKVNKIISTVTKYIEEDIWKQDLDEISGFKAFFIRALRILIIGTRGYTKDKCPMKASALTFFSLLSIVPVIALGFGIAKGFGLEKILERQLRKSLEGQEEVIEKTIDFAHSMLETTQGGMIAGIGLLILFWTVMRLLNDIEASFNDIWYVKKPRSFTRKFTDYVTIMLIAPILIVLSSSITVFITTQIKNITQGVEVLEYVTPFIFFMLRLMPYIIMWLLFTLLYVIIPNTSVNIKSALIAGIFAGTIFQLVQWGYINFQVGMSRNNAIYGSFAALPLFLIWLQLSWLIILFGAEISYAIQNVNRYEFDNLSLHFSDSLSRKVAIVITYVIVKRFATDEKPYTIQELIHNLRIPVRFIEQTVNRLVECKILAVLHKGGQKHLSYQPAIDTDLLTVDYVVSRIDSIGMNDIDGVEPGEDFIIIENAIKPIYNQASKASEAILLKNL